MVGTNKGETMNTKEEEEETKKTIDELRKVIARYKTELEYYTKHCAIVWLPEDVEESARQCNLQRPSLADCYDILKMMESNWDAGEGVSWDTLHFWCHEILTNMPDDYYEKLKDDDWGDHPLNNREVVYFDEE
jgi:hypothetical protein